MVRMPSTWPASTGASTLSLNKEGTISTCSRSMSLGKVRVMEPRGFTFTSSAWVDRFTFTLVTRVSSGDRVTR